MVKIQVFVQIVECRFILSTKQCECRHSYNDSHSSVALKTHAHGGVADFTIYTCILEENIIERCLYATTKVFMTSMFRPEKIATPRYNSKEFINSEPWVLYFLHHYWFLRPRFSFSNSQVFKLEFLNHLELTFFFVFREIWFKWRPLLHP